MARRASSASISIALARLVAAGRIEIIGGAFYEPILAMIPRARPRRPDPQLHPLAAKTGWARTVRGMWMPERVWEQSMTSDLVAAGIEYTMLDDFHFKNAGLTRRATARLLPDRGRRPLLAVFPGSERLRYMIPFAAPQETIDYLGRMAERAARRGRRLRRRRRKVRRLAGNARSTSTTTAGCVRFFDLLVGQPELDPSRSRRPKRSTACRRSARSICPRAAIAK